jgi:hypothetical protein
MSSARKLSAGMAACSRESKLVRAVLDDPEKFAE